MNNNKEKTWKEAVFSWSGIAILLVISQILVKFFVEFPKIVELGGKEKLPLNETAWVMVAFWIILVPLLALKHKKSYLLASLWGFFHFPMALMPLIVGDCNHWIAGPTVAIQGLAIGVVCYICYKKMQKGEKV